MLWGGAGNDIFYFREGNPSDVVFDFQAGAASGDASIVSSAMYSSKQAVLDSLVQSNGDTLVVTGGGNSYSSSTSTRRLSISVTSS
jgi:Ca2+-binding RTX toxin-like protein